MDPPKDFEVSPLIGNGFIARTNISWPRTGQAGTGSEQAAHYPNESI